MFSLTQFIRRSAQINPSGLATVSARRQVNWRELVERVASLAAGLRAVELDDGDPVAILSLNSDDYYEALFAIPWAGGVNVPINTRLAPPEVAYWLNDCQAKVVLVSEEFVEVIHSLRDQLPHLKTVIGLGEVGSSQYLDRDYSWLLDHQPMDDCRRANEDLAAIYYTGGTTGRSKGVMLSHRNLVGNTLQTASFLNVADNEKILHVAPMFHVADGVMINACAMVAGCNYFLSAFDPVAVMTMIEGHGIERVMMVPTMINMLVHHPDIDQHDLSTLKHVLYGASPIPEAVIRKAMDVLPHTNFCQGYGQTETSPFITGLPSDYHVLSGPKSGKLTSAGRAVAGVEVEIHDGAGAEVKRGEVGEICVRGPNVMKGYLGMPAETQETLRDGWLHTGDSGRMDDEGFVYVVDRVKDMIVSGAENVYSIEVEDAIHKHPAVVQCAVIGVPDQQWGERVHAVVVLSDLTAVNAETLKQHCREWIADYKCPRSFEFQTELLPLSGAGKVLKKNLRERIQEVE